jgi:hypothetical protein
VEDEVVERSKARSKDKEHERVLTRYTQRLVMRVRICRLMGSRAMDTDGEEDAGEELLVVVEEGEGEVVTG